MLKIAVVPALEPDENILCLLKELKKNNYKIIVVNDGSDESYDDIFKECSKYSFVLKHDYNMGKGAALKTAFSYIKNNYNNYVIVTIDADNQHKVSDANKLVNYIMENNRCLALGKRVRDKNTPLRSRIGNFITKEIFKIITGINIYDTQTGLRCFSSELIDFMINIDGERYEYEMNMLLKCHKNKIRMKEIEIETIYIDDNKGSHFRTFSDSIKIYKELLKNKK